MSVPIQIAMVLVPPDLFVGLITHPGSRFADARAPDGLAAQIVFLAQQAGWTVASSTIDEDLFDSASRTIRWRDVRASIDAELATERAWREYVKGMPASLMDRFLFAIRKGWRTFKLAPRFGSTTQHDYAGPRMIRRLLNIELAHMTVMQAALHANARWSLILEDDARSENVEQFTRELMEFINARENAGHVAVANLSESFSIDQLAITHLLRDHPLPSQPESWRIFEAERIVTNTVCAVLYRRDFLQAMYAAVEAIPTFPVMPIDFKINKAVMDINAQWPHGSCLVVSPAPLTQASGVPNVRA